MPPEHTGGRERLVGTYNRSFPCRIQNYLRLIQNPFENCSGCDLQLSLDMVPTIRAVTDCSSSVPRKEMLLQMSIISRSPQTSPSPATQSEAFFESLSCGVPTGEGQVSHLTPAAVGQN